MIEMCGSKYASVRGWRDPLRASEGERRVIKTREGRKLKERDREDSEVIELVPVTVKELWAVWQDRVVVARTYCFKPDRDDTWRSSRYERILF